MNLTCSPIGIIHSGKKVKFETPHQPADGIEENNTITLFPNHRLEIGLRDLEGFERIWLIWWFQKNKTWKPLVSPPRGSGKKRGVFATRSPHRPCPIGITAVRLLSVQSNSITVGNVDLLDGTPILDIKPYISEIDSFPDQKQGWLDEEAAEIHKPPQYQVIMSERARAQSLWLLEKWNIDFHTKAISILERNPHRSRTNRITSPKDGISRLSSGAWRVYFSIQDQQVEITDLGAGYPMELLTKKGFEIIPDWEAQIAFITTWNKN